MLARRSLLLSLAVSGCVAPMSMQTTDLESSDRAARFGRLSYGSGGVPVVTQVSAPFGGVPVTVVAFDEDAFFSSGSARPRAEAQTLLDIVAENMRRDVPDAQLTLLGHTDAVGSDALNDQLSLRRARAVLGQLVRRQVNAGQLSTVAIGRRQPIAPNLTAEGRARNRRVEFLVSSSLEANLAVIQNRAVPIGWLSAGMGPPRPAPQRSVAVLRPASGQASGSGPVAKSLSGPSDISEAPLLETQKLPLNAPTP